MIGYVKYFDSNKTVSFKVGDNATKYGKNTYFSIWVIDCIITAFSLTYFNTIRIANRFTSVNINYF